MTRTALGAAGAVAVVLAALLLLLSRPAPRPAAVDRIDAPAATHAPSDAQAAAVHREPAAAAGATAAPSRDLLLPDGTSVPTLNGATDAEPLATYWGPFPWSPIVGVERNDQGLDWYRHADGSYSTTQMVWRQDLGRMAAMTRVAHPGPQPASPATR